MFELAFTGKETCIGLQRKTTLTDYKTVSSETKKAVIVKLLSMKKVKTAAYFPVNFYL